ncbi:TIGR01777 family oxidoreductase [Aliiglaciecola litoralis]|uniref:TIGR01777 family oxidoreductase n=1 Tax=Aliiglaciecola litoralis TaxID=582857 RepID=A0ABN1LD81_9ALTE
MQHILITGGTGLIGRALIDKLTGPDYKITVLTRHPKAAKSSLPASTKLITSLQELSNLNDVDAVINLAGEPIVNKRWSTAQKHKIEQSRFATTESLVNLINKSNPPPSVFISGSAIGYYGRQDEHPIDESFDSPHPEYSHTLCKTWENIAFQAQSERTRVCLLRTGIVLSGQGGALSKMVLPFKLGLGGPIGDGKHIMSWIHIDDMVDGILFLLRQKKCQGVYNFTAPNAVSNRVFSKALASAVNRPCVLFTPKLVLTLAMGEMADLLIYGQNVVPRRLLEDGFTFIYTDIDEAFNSLSL